MMMINCFGLPIPLLGAPLVLIYFIFDGGGGREGVPPSGSISHQAVLFEYCVLSGYTFCQFFLSVFPPGIQSYAF